GRPDPLDPAAISDVVNHLRPLELPRVAEGQPVFRIFLLPAILDDLAEETVVIADAVAARGNPQARHALHKAGREPAEPAVPEGRIGLGSPHAAEVHPEIAERDRSNFRGPKISEDIVEQAPDQELQ